MVNELIVDYDESGIVRDEWFNFKPPDYAHGYAAEIQSSVMRYHEGKVSRAPGWYWGRPDTEPGLPKAEGVIWRMQSHNVPQYAVQYKSFTTFSCGPLLPFVVAEGDPSTRADEPHLCPLLFFHPPSNDPMRGVSQVAFEESVLDGGPGPARYTAGRSPSWVSSLVPSAYSNQEANAPRSTGLGGELPIVLGLMAFSEARNPDSLENRTDEIFVGMPGHHGRWHDRRWTHNHRPSGCEYASRPFYTKSKKLTEDWCRYHR